MLAVERQQLETREVGQREAKDAGGLLPEPVQEPSVGSATMAKDENQRRGGSANSRAAAWW